MTFFNCFNKIASVPKKAAQKTWEEQAPIAKRDLIIKKIVIGLVALLNFAALGGTLYLIIQYCPVPNQAMFVSPFIVGVLAGLANVKFPTFGVTSVNYINYTNPTALIGRGLAYLFFGPLMYAIEHVDRTPYHDRIHANTISTRLETLPFDQIADEYGDNFDNLIKYGFLKKRYRKRVTDLYSEYQKLREEKNFWKGEKEGGHQEYTAAQEKIEKLNERWTAITKRYNFTVPHPKNPTLDLADRKTRVKYKWREFFYFNTSNSAVTEFKV